jgi:hypothetical protein
VGDKAMSAPDFKKIAEDLIDQYYPQQRVAVAKALRAAYVAGVKDASIIVETTNKSLLEGLASLSRSN